MGPQVFLRRSLLYVTQSHSLHPGRPGLNGWVMLNLQLVIAQYMHDGHLSLPMALSCGLQAFYILDVCVTGSQPSLRGQRIWGKPYLYCPGSFAGSTTSKREAAGSIPI